MTKITSKDKVSCLSFEGGGGKGITFLGAIAALEELGILPINTGQVKGISGASAGAITAMLLAMDYSFAELTNVFLDQLDLHRKNIEKLFNNLLDDPKPGQYRLVNKKNKPDVGGSKVAIDSVKRAVLDILPENIEMLKLLIAISPGINPVTYPDLFATPLREKIIEYLLMLALDKFALGALDDNTLNKLKSGAVVYLYNLLYDRGLFPGIGARNFLREMATGKKINPDIDFADFYKKTGVDFVVTGTNTQKHKPAVFSRRHTPDFPVTEAVGISMSVPLVFKPVCVEVNVPVETETGKIGYNKTKEDYQGYWVDGGLLNNFPLHAFDAVDFDLPPGSEKNKVPKETNLKPLNPGMLGLRLQEPRKDLQLFREPQNEFNLRYALEFFGDLYFTLFYPSEEGQIRSEDERAQTIPLNIYDLNMLNFTPSWAECRIPIRDAYYAIFDYFKIPHRKPRWWK